MAVFRILHLSDLHVGAKPDVVGGVDVRLRSQHPRGTANPLRASSWNRGLGKVVRGFTDRNHQRQPLDAVLVSGDLATTGKKADLVCALDYVEDLIQAARWATGPDSHPGVPIRRVILFPGNHDRFRRGLFWPGGKRFDRIFSDYWQGPVQTTVLASGAARERLAIIQADFSLQKRSHTSWSSFEYLGQGRVYDSILERLKAETEEQLAMENAVVWAVHFPPDFVPISNDLRLQDQMKLLYAARHLKVNCIFAGHTHVQRHYTTLGVDVYCAGTATQLVVPQGTPAGGNWIHPCTITVSGRFVTNVDWQEWKFFKNLGGFAPTNPPGSSPPGWVS
jgi:3',5'-cyclic AMP phosphodiesterase CpdA